MTKQHGSPETHLLAWNLSYEKEQVDLGPNQGRARTWTLPFGPFEPNDAHV